MKTLLAFGLPLTINLMFLGAFAFGYSASGAIVLAAPLVDYTLTPSQTTILVRTSLTISFTAPSGSSSTDWIGFYKVGDPNTGSIWWQYTGGATSGNGSLTTPNTPGQYEFRYFLNGTYTVAATSDPVTVTYGTFTLTPSASEFCGCSSISVSWTAPSNRYSTDWISISKVGSASNSNVGWYYTNGTTSGTLTYAVPGNGIGTYDPGSYEFRYYIENTYTIVQTSSSVSLVDAPYSVSAEYQAGDGKVHIVWSAPHDRTTEKKDWIGVYNGGDDHHYYSYFYTGIGGAPCGKNALTLSSNTYDFRYFINDGYTKMANSNSVTVP